MNKLITVLLSVAFFLCGCNGKSPQEEPASQAVSAAKEDDNQADVKAVSSDPETDAVKELIKKSHLAVCNDDATAFAQCFVADEKTKSLTDSIFACAKAQYQLEEAIVKRFGEDGLDLFRDPEKPDGVYVASFMAPPKEEAWWDDPDIDIEIDMDDLVGEYYNPWSNTTTPLRKQEGRWLFDFSQVIAPDNLPFAVETQANLLKGMQNCLELLKQENVKVIDLNIEMGKSFKDIFGIGSE